MVGRVFKRKKARQPVRNGNGNGNGNGREQENRLDPEDVIGRFDVDLGII